MTGDVPPRPPPSSARWDPSAEAASSPPASPQTPSAPPLPSPPTYIPAGPAGTRATLLGAQPPITGSHALASPPQKVRFPAPGDILGSVRGSYRVTRVMGHGAHGAVYEASGPFDQRFAVKMLVPANRPYAEVHGLWTREAQRLLVLRHPGVVYMHDAFEQDFLFYMALEWCSHTLKDMLVGPLKPETAIEFTRQILAAVQYLHDNDVVHGDLHPGNVLLTQGERPTIKLADFGISQELHGRGFARPDIVHHAIMPPEIVAAGYTSRQSDIYQVGLLLYWMVVGAPPLDYEVPYAELVRQVSEGVPRARAEALGTPLGAVIAKMLRRREAYRYASAREVWEDLRPTLRGG